MVWCYVVIAYFISLLIYVFIVIFPFCLVFSLPSSSSFFSPSLILHSSHTLIYPSFSPSRLSLPCTSSLFHFPSLSSLSSSYAISLLPSLPLTLFSLPPSSLSFSYPSPPLLLFLSPLIHFLMLFRFLTFPFISSSIPFLHLSPFFHSVFHTPLFPSLFLFPPLTLLFIFNLPLFYLFSLLSLITLSFPLLLFSFLFLFHLTIHNTLFSPLPFSSLSFFLPLITSTSFLSLSLPVSPVLSSHSSCHSFPLISFLLYFPLSSNTASSPCILPFYTLSLPSFLLVFSLSSSHTPSFSLPCFRSLSSFSPCFLPVSSLVSFPYFSCPFHSPSFPLSSSHRLHFLISLFFLIFPLSSSHPLLSLISLFFFISLSPRLTPFSLPFFLFPYFHSLLPSPPSLPFFLFPHFPSLLLSPLFSLPFFLLIFSLSSSHPSRVLSLLSSSFRLPW